VRRGRPAPDRAWPRQRDTEMTQARAIIYSLAKYNKLASSIDRARPHGKQRRSEKQQDVVVHIKRRAFIGV
jgi:hypothetical protein